jgi:hypothetical protein
MTNVSSTIDSALTMVMGDDMVKVSDRRWQGQVVAGAEKQGGVRLCCKAWLCCAVPPTCGVALLHCLHCLPRPSCHATPQSCLWTETIPLLPLPILSLPQVVAWYDNEWGYSQRVVDLAEITATKWE